MSTFAASHLRYRKGQSFPLQLCYARVAKDKVCQTPLSATFANSPTGNQASLQSMRLCCGGETSPRRKAQGIANDPAHVTNREERN